MVDDTGLDAPVPLPMVDSKILIKVIEYCKYHHKAEQESLPEDEKTVWDKDFVKVHALPRRAASPRRRAAAACSGGVQRRRAAAACSGGVQRALPVPTRRLPSQVDDETLFNLILAANYLDIKPLLDLTCKTVADEIKGKTPEEIRIRFNIKNDFTPEEEEEVKRENAWCEER